MERARKQPKRSDRDRRLPRRAFARERDSYADVIAAQQRLVLDFDALARAMHKPLLPEDARIFARYAASTFIEDAMMQRRARVETLRRLCQTIAGRIARLEKPNARRPTEKQLGSLRELLEQADSLGLFRPPSLVRCALRDPRLLGEVRKQAKLTADVLRGNPHKAKNYRPFRVFARSLWRVYQMAGGDRRYTRREYPDYNRPDKTVFVWKYKGESIDFATEAIGQTCKVLPIEIVRAVCPPSQNWPREIARAIDNADDLDF